MCLYVCVCVYVFSKIYTYYFSSKSSAGLDIVCLDIYCFILFGYMIKIQERVLERDILVWKDWEC